MCSKRVIATGIAMLVGVANPTTAAVAGTAFTYQGHLTFSSQPINNEYDICFSLYGEEAQEPGHPACASFQGLAGPIVFDGNGSNPPPVTVADGIFTVVLDFQDPALFDGKALWLEISLKPHGPDPDYILLAPRQLITGTPYAQGLRYPQVAEAELVAPMFQMTQSGEGPAMQLEGRRDPVIITSASPLFSVSSHGGGVAASIASEPVPDPMWTPDPTIPSFIAKNMIGGVAGSFVTSPLAFNPDPPPTLVATNRATGVAGLFYIPDPDAPPEDGCPPQCPPFPWPWVDVVAPGIDVINQSGGPAGRFVTDSNLLLPAVHVANAGMGSAIHAMNSHAAPTLEATNNGGGSAGKLVAVAFNPQPDPPSPALVATHQGGGGAAKFESYAFNPQPDPPVLNTVPTVEVTNHGGGGAAKFEAVAFNPQPDPPGFPAIDVIHGGGGPAGRFLADTELLLPAILVTNTGDGMACQAVSQGTAAAIEATNTGAGPAMKALSNNSGDPAFEANNSAGTAIKAIGGNGICFDGEGDLRVTGDIQRNYGNGSPSFHRTGPIAYATINSDGTVAAGTPNVSCTWNLPSQRYDITITDESYSNTEYVTTVTPVAIAPAETLFANTTSGLGQLRVRILSSSTGTVGQQKPFHFVVYKP